MGVQCFSFGVNLYYLMLANELMICKSERTNLYGSKISHFFRLFLEQVEEKHAKNERQQQRSNIIQN